MTRRAVLPPQTVAPGDYEKFADFCRRVDEAEKAQVILRDRGGAAAAGAGAARGGNGDGDGNGEKK